MVQSGAIQRSSFNPKVLGSIPSGGILNWLDTRERTGVSHQPTPRFRVHASPSAADGVYANARTRALARAS
jgi:hypothetical protein